MFYCDLNRARVLAELRQSSDRKSHLTVLGREWSVLSEQDKRPYREMAANDSIRYQRQTEAYDSWNRARLLSSVVTTSQPPAAVAQRSATTVVAVVKPISPPAHVVLCPLCRQENRVQPNQPTVRGDNLGECQVCLDKTVEVFLPQCGHTVLCWDCLRAIAQK
jgi:hypothetical protein